MRIEWPLKFSFIDFKDVVSVLAVHAESKMILFTSGLLQGFTSFNTAGKEVGMFDVHQDL